MPVVQPVHGFFFILLCVGVVACLWGSEKVVSNSGWFTMLRVLSLGVGERRDTISQRRFYNEDILHLVT